ncbi:MAG: hypothetical protein ACI4CS_07220 [Candidatus Weimeria sp.]
MTFSQFAGLFHTGRGKTALKGITDQAGIVYFLLCLVPEGTAETLTFSDDYYRMMFTGKKKVPDRYWWMIEKGISDTERTKGIFYERLADKYADTIGEKLGLVLRDKKTVSEALARVYLNIAKGLGETEDDIKVLIKTAPDKGISDNNNNMSDTTTLDLLFKDGGKPDKKPISVTLNLWKGSKKPVFGKQADLFR